MSGRPTVVNLEPTTDKDGLVRSRAFWNDKARESPYWYISSFTNYQTPDVTAFWESGSRIWRDLKGATRYFPGRDHAVLEIGCGIGRLSRAIARDVGVLISVDISQDMIDRARAENPDLTFAVVDGASLATYESSRFDAVVAYCVWQHLPSHVVFHQCVHEAHRVLRPGGRLIFTYSRRSWKDMLRPFMKARAWARERLFGGPKGLYQHAWLGIRLTEAEAMSACRAAGFSSVSGSIVGLDRNLMVAGKA